MAARVELRACDRLEAVVGDPELGRVEGEHRGIAADRAGEQKFERARRAILPAHMCRLADDEFEAAALALDELVEPADRRHLDLDEALRSLRRRLFRIGAVAALARIGGLLQCGKAVADFGHSMSPEMQAALCIRIRPSPRKRGPRSRIPRRRFWIPAISAFTRVFGALCAGMNGPAC